VRLRFGDCLLDSDERQLTRDGRKVPLPAKAFRLLEVLAERRPRAVSLAELRKLLWPEAIVGGTTVARLVCEVRAAIDDEARSAHFIRTLHGFGYAFSGPATEETAAAQRARGRCAVQWGARLVALAPGENVIGRDPDAAISISLGRVSRSHARILVEDGRAVLEDLGSKNGTLVGDRRIDAPVELKHGDVITIGPVLLVFRQSTNEESTF
jgi:DNA-binding winged helix-turn-helix (wHTH) protein